MPKLVIEIESPTETTAGAILEGHYTIQDGKVRVIDAAGRPVGSEEVAPGNDPAVIARRILRRARSHSRNFHGPLRYPPLSIV